MCFLKRLEGLMLSAFSGKEKKPFSISEGASDEWQIHGHDFTKCNTSTIFLTRFLTLYEMISD